METSSQCIKSSQYELRIQDGILYAKYLKPTTVDLNITKKSFKDRNKLTQGKAYPILGDVKNVKYWTREAQLFHSTTEYSESVKALALIIKNPVGGFLINFYLTCFPKLFPVKTFTSESEALTWLQKYKE
ncbi:MAG: hypothetical protein ACK4ND_06970 [Cytophagaceae bacterium]